MLDTPETQNLRVCFFVVRLPYHPPTTPLIDVPMLKLVKSAMLMNGFINILRSVKFA